MAGSRPGRSGHAPVGQVGPAIGTETFQSEAHLVSVTVVQVVEDFQGLMPGIPGLLLVIAGVAGVAEVGEDFGFVEAVPEFPEKAESVLVAVGGVAVTAELALDVAEAVPGVCLLAAMEAEFLVQGESLSAERAGPLRLAQHRVAIAEDIESRGLPGSVPDGPEQVKGLLGMAERVAVST